MNKILYLYWSKKNINVDKLNLQNIEIGDDKDYPNVLKLVEPYLNDSSAIIIDANSFSNESDIFEFITYIRLSYLKNWDLPIFLYAKLGPKNLYKLLKSDNTSISKTNRFELINDSEFELDILTNEPTILQTIHRMKNEVLNWGEFINIIEIKNHETDNHTISNEWAIYRWATLLDIHNEEIKEVYSKVENDLYFKYLKAKYPILDAEQFNNADLEIPFSGNPKVLLIDDESEKGWSKIFACLLGNKNNMYVDYLGEDFKNSSSDFIIDKSLHKIKTDNIDIVILDFRLNSDDFNAKIEEITSVKLLKEIKSFNPGIQVIVFSATNKIWNLQTLQKHGCDGFIVKDTANIEVGKNFTRNSIETLKSDLAISIEKIFSKDLFRKYDYIYENLKNLDYEDDSDFEKFLEELLSQLKIIKEITKLINPQVKSTVDIVFLNCFNFLEQFKKHYLHYDDEFYLLGAESETLNEYYFSRNNTFCEKGYFRKIQNERYTPSWFNVLCALAIDYFAICDSDNELIDDLDILKNNRNNFIHEDKDHFDKNDLITIVDIMFKFSENMKE